MTDDLTGPTPQGSGRHGRRAQPLVPDSPRRRAREEREEHGRAPWDSAGWSAPLPPVPAERETRRPAPQAPVEASTSWSPPRPAAPPAPSWAEHTAPLEPARPLVAPPVDEPSVERTIRWEPTAPQAPVSARQAAHRPRRGRTVPSAAAPVAAPAATGAPVPVPRATRRTPPGGPAPRTGPSRTTGSRPPARGERTGAASATLPWHLRRRFLLPVVALCLLGSLSCLTLLGLTAYSSAHGGSAATTLRDVVLSATDSGQAGSTPATAAKRSTATATAAAPGSTSTSGPSQPASATSPKGQDAPADQVAAAPAAAATSAPAADAAKAAAPAASSTAPAPTAAAAAQGATGDVTYEGFGTAKATVVDYTVAGTDQGDDSLGAAFTLRQPGSAAWKGWYVSVTGTGSGSVGCRIRDASGKVLAEDSTSTAGDTAECAWGDQDAGTDTTGDPDDGADG